MAKDDTTQNAELEQENGEEVEEGSESEDTSTETTTENTESSESQESQDSQDDIDWKAETLKWRAIANRRRKADSSKPSKESESSQESSQEERPSEDLSAKDAITLMKAEVTEEEDIQEVMDYAKYRNISISEALKSNVVKSVLSERKEERQTAEATSTGDKRGGSTAASGGELLRRAKSEGELPDDDEGMRKLAASQFEE